jgi:heme oxygenase
MPPSTRRFLLRERTADRHQAVDDAVGSFDTLQHYCNYLQGLYSFRLPLEAWLGDLDWPPHFGRWRPMPIGEIILRDMDDLNVTERRIEPSIPQHADLETLLGALYVLEGSSLGARLLVSRARRLGLDETYGARHLASQAQSDGWKSFLQLLDTAPTMDMDKVVGASRTVFAHAETAFKGILDA